MRCHAPAHEPFLNTSGVRDERCVFMTGVSTNVSVYLPGLLCIARRLEQVGSQVPLVIAVPAAEVALARAALSNINATILVWRQFPVELKLRWGQRRWRGRHVLDKLNLLGAPYRRLVWLDTDVLIRRNVDALCSSTAGRWSRASFAAAVDSGFEPRTCWQSGGARCDSCRHHGVHPDELCEHKCSHWVRRGIMEQAAGNRSGMPRCVYEFNSGVMLIAPLSRANFQRRVVRVLRCDRPPSREGWSRDGGDQGVLNNLVHGRRVMGDRVGVLPSKYNGLHRVSALRPQAWRRWDPALVHIVGERKPWSEGIGSALLPHATNEEQPIGFAAMSFEWLQLCGVPTP